MKDTIIVIGSSNVDMIMKVDHIPAKGETVINGNFMQVYGGKGANQAVAAARAGGEVAFISCVGDDVFAPPFTRNLKEDGINTTYLYKETGVPCGTALIMIDEFGENIITVAPGANLRLTPDHLETASEMITNSKIIVLQNEIPVETVERAIDMAVKAGIKVLYNLAPARELNPSYLNKIDFLILNEFEASFLTGKKVESVKQAQMAADGLRKKGVKTVIVTLGSQGSVVSDETFTEKVDAFKVEVLDTTAAGDIFCGSLAVAITEGKQIKNAVRFATASSALAVSKMGAQPSAPTRKEIESFLNENFSSGS